MKNHSFGKCCQAAFLLIALSPFIYSQDIQWQQVLGGIHSEYLYDVKATPDYGFLLAGSSFSEDSGNKTEKGKGDLDYFLWKMDEEGKMEWQKTFGSAGSDYLYSVGLTRDGGFILGGASETSGSGFESPQPPDGDKKDPGFGNMDFWILKLDPTGKEEWQVTLGGIGNDQLQSIQQTPDGGYIIGGSSASTSLSDRGGELETNPNMKQSDNFGSFDYWVVKLSSLGEIEWEKTFGGMFSDELKSILITEDGYLIGGNSNSPASRLSAGTAPDLYATAQASQGEENPPRLRHPSEGGEDPPRLRHPSEGGEKTAENSGMNDYWVIRLNEQGEEQWQRTYGGDGDESLAQMIETEKGFLLAGSSNSSPLGRSGGASNGTDFWVIEIDKQGEPLWDKTYDFGKWDVLVSVLPLTPSKGGGTPSSGGGTSSSGEYLLGGYASTETLGKRMDNKGVNDYIALKINDRGEMLWSKTIGGTGTDQLKGLTRTRDGGYILAGNSDSKKSDDKDKASIGGSDYWVVKLGNEKKTDEERQLVEVYPNPTYQFTNIIISQEFKEASVQVFDMTGRKLQTKVLPYRSTPIDLQGYLPGVYIFKITVDGKTEDVKVIKKGNN